MESPVVLWTTAYLLNSIWQIPVVLLSALLAARMAARLGPEAVHRVCVGALLLAVALPACHFASWSFPWLGGSGVVSGGSVRVTVMPGIAGSARGLRFAHGVLLTLLALYGASVLYSLARLLYGWRTVRRIQGGAAALGSGFNGFPALAALQASFDRNNVRIAATKGIAGPMVAGVAPAMLLLPEGFLERVTEQDARAALAHELAHVKRRDSVKNLVYLLLTAPVAYHPCTWALRMRVVESREMVCDAMAAAATGGTRRYARSLLRLAGTVPVALGGSALPAVGIFDGNALERRVTHMLNQQRKVSRAGQVAAVAGILLLTVGAGASVTAMHLNVSANSLAADRPQLLHVRRGVMAGNILSRVNPKYPAKAKADHVTGTCTLGLIIDKAGVPTHIHVVKSVRKDIDESAVTAVRQWRWKPYLLNGDPIAVESTVNITYSLAK